MGWLPLPEQPARPDLGYGAASVSLTGSSASYRYQEVYYLAFRSGRCPMCGKRRNRQHTFFATTSPFNVDPETGLPRAYAQVRAVLQEQAERWVPDFTCATACAPPAPPSAPSSAPSAGSQR